MKPRKQRGATDMGRTDTRTSTAEAESTQSERKPKQNRQNPAGEITGSTESRRPS